MPGEVGVTAYVIRFALVFLALILGIGVLLSLLDLESNAGATVAALMGAAMMATERFIKDHGRAPDKSEKRRLVWLSYLASWLVSLVPFGIFLALSGEGAAVFEAISAMHLGVLAGLAAFLSIFYLLALSFAYGYLATKQLASLERKGKLKPRPQAD